MKKTLLQMLLTCAMLLGIHTANEQILLQDVQTVSTQETSSVTLPIIMYHGILRDSAQAGEYIISPDTLEADLDYLQKQGYETITIQDLVRYVDGLADLPEKPILLTFDDGHYNNYLYAYPLLQERGMKAVISVIGEQTEQFTQSGQENPYWSYLTLNRLKEMSDVFEVQNHSYAMHELTPRKGSTRMRGESIEDYQKILIADTERVQQLITDAGISAPICYTYPYGIYTSESEQLLHSLGFLCTLTCEERVNQITNSPDSLYALGRFNRPAGISTEEFFAKILQE